MAAKKTNYISYEIEKLEKYYKQLEKYLDDNPADEIEDRLDVRYSQNDNPIVRVIASKEAQLKAFFDTLQKLPALLESINNLRKLVESDGIETPEKARGGVELPGIFKSRMLTQGDIEEPKKSDDVWEEEDE